MKWNRGLLVGTLSVAAFVLAGGLWLEHVVTMRLERGLREELTTLRDTNLVALSEWMRAQKNASGLAATQEDVRTAALQVIRGARGHELDSNAGTLPRGEASRQLHDHLRFPLEHWKFKGYLLLSGRRVVAADNEEYLGREIEDADFLPLLSQLKLGKSVMSLPRLAASGPDDDYVMWVASAIRDGQGVQGTLAFRIDPAESFSRILRTSRFGISGETITFDAKGLLLSSSRFDDQLRKVGLLQADEDSRLQLTLRDPGIDLTQVSQLPKSLGTHDLTLAVRSAIDGRTDSNVEGYSDYRGVRVAGAWTWLPEYEFGLVTKVDWEEAMGSANVIRRVTRILVGSLLLLALVLVFVGQMLARLRHEARRLGQYTLQKKIGEGGMGAVYQAQHALLRRPTAVKMIKAHEMDESTRGRFEREVQATAQLTHPNTIAIYDYGHTDEGVFYYAMEYLEGLTLHELVRSYGTVGQARAVHILKQVLGSLNEAHSAGLVHRDIKPANIMVSLRGGVPDTVKVLDFGLVKDVSGGSTEAALTASNSVTGTPQYMSPESIMDASEVDQRSDLYAVGAVAYFLLTARELFDGPSIMVILTKHLTDPPPRPSDHNVVIDPQLEALILRCLEKLPSLRPASAHDMLIELEALSEKPGLRWSSEEALVWWRNRPELQASVDSGLGSRTPTIAIDMERRSLR